MRNWRVWVAVWLFWAIGGMGLARAVDYKLPWPGGRSFQCTQGNRSGFSHTGVAAYAWDFGMAVGSEVVAAADGTVVLVRENSNRGGPDPSFGASANYVVISHAAERYSAYLHLQYNGVEVEVGDFVRQGQLIAHSGNTGYSTGAHLHFQVQISGERSLAQSVPIRFSDVIEDGGVPRSGKRYTSGNTFDPTRPIDPTVNRFPVFVSSPVLRAVAGRWYRYDMEATDPNDDPLTYSLVVYPLWLSVDPTSGLVSGIVPAEGLPGVTLIVRVDDERGGFDKQLYTVRIFEPPAPPIGIFATPTEEGAGIVLTWGPSPDDAEGGPITGYRIYRGERSEIAEAVLLDSTASGVIQYVDEHVPSGVSLYYWIQAVDEQGIPSDPVGTEEPITGIELAASETRPASTALDRNVPNPFNGATDIAYRLSEPGPVTLAVYTVTGQRVRTLMDGDQEAGRHYVRWDGLNDLGHPVASGVYVYRMSTRGFSAAQIMTLMR